MSLKVSSRTKLSELAEIKHGFAFPGEHIVSQETSRILLTPGHFEVGGGFRHHHKKYFDTHNYKDGYELEVGDLIVTMTDLSKAGDTLGYGAVVPYIKGKTLLHNQRIGKVLIKSANLDQGFCHYLLRSKHYRQHVLATSTGSTVRHTSPTKILSYEFELPPISDQKATAHILGTLDDKIELNRKMNETLEEIAKAIFKSWFVDFDPVRAKMEGRPTGLPDDISNLFPDELEDSEIGEIPKGWDILKIGNIAKVTSGKRPPEKRGEQCDEFKYVLYGGAGPMAFCNEPLQFTKPAIITGRVGTLGKVFYLLEECWVSDNSLLIQDAGVYSPLVFYTLQRFDLASLNVGSTQPLLTGTDIKTLALTAPPGGALEIYASIFRLLKDRQIIASEEGRILTDLRDTLLPKLISGELQVPDAEKFLVDAGI